MQVVYSPDGMLHDPPTEVTRGEAKPYLGNCIYSYFPLPTSSALLLTTLFRIPCTSCFYQGLHWQPTQPIQCHFTSGLLIDPHCPSPWARLYRVPFDYPSRLGQGWYACCRYNWRVIRSFQCGGQVGSCRAQKKCQSNCHGSYWLLHVWHVCCFYERYAIYKQCMIHPMTHVVDYLDTWRAAYVSAQIAMTAAHKLLKEQSPSIYALCRPPGHHATCNVAGGK